MLSANEPEHATYGDPQTPGEILAHALQVFGSQADPLQRLAPKLTPDQARTLRKALHRLYHATREIGQLADAYFAAEHPASQEAPPDG